MCCVLTFPAVATRYALTVKEVQMILKQRNVLVDGRARTDTTFPTGFMDVVSIPKTGENFRLLYDAKGRYVPLPVNEEEAKVRAASWPLFASVAQCGPVLNSSNCLCRNAIVA